jgi:excinuclease UvrABC nuclease subunit
MQTRRTWRPFTDSSVKSAPTQPGAYELGDAKGEVVYIGKGGGSVSRLLKHREKKIFMHVKYFRFQKTEVDSEAKALEYQLCTLYKKMHNGKLPRLQCAAPITAGRHRFWG